MCTMKIKLIGIIIFLGVWLFRFPMSNADQDGHSSSANNNSQNHSTHQHQPERKESAGIGKHRFHSNRSGGKVHHSQKPVK